MWREFRDFAFKATVFDLAVAFIMGVAFAAVVSSLVKDLIMPIISLITGGVDFSNWFITLKGGPYATLAEAQKAGAATLNLGVFLNTVINFVIVAFVIYLLVRAYNKARPSKPEEITTKDCLYCKTPIPLSALRCPNCTSDIKAVA